MTCRSIPGVLWTVVLLAAPSTGAAQQEVLLTREQALREIFPAAVHTVPEQRTLSASDMERLHRQLGRPVYDDVVEVTRVYDASSRLIGYAVVTEEVGKYRPITFMVGVTPALRVQEVAVMVYREPRGGEVRRKRFLDQYRGKSLRDPLDSNRDIINISGATISVRSMNSGVKRVLAELALLYPPEAGIATTR